MDKQLGDTVKKFMFDINDFDEAALRRKETLARRPTFSQEEMEAARQTGVSQGRVEGLKEALESQESQIRDLCQQLVLTADRLTQDETDRLATFIDQSALIAVQALTRALPVLLNTLAVDQIAAFVNKVLEDQSKGCSLVIRVAPTHEAAIKERLEAMVATLHRKPDWVISSDPSLTGLQCKIEWTGGGAEWNPQAVAEAVLQTITAHLPEHLRADAIPATAPDAAPAIDEAPQTPHTETEPSGDVP